jgi:hypothetical protein
MYKFADNRKTQLTYLAFLILKLALFGLCSLKESWLHDLDVFVIQIDSWPLILDVLQLFSMLVVASWTHLSLVLSLARLCIVVCFKLVFMQSVANLCTPQFKKKKKPIFQPNSG